MKISQSQLEQYLSKAAWILKGPVDASDFKSYIFPLLFFKRISDVYDEEYEIALKESGNDKEYASLKEFHRFIIPKDCHWKDVRNTTTNVGLKIENSLRGIEKANIETLYEIFGDTQWGNKDKLPDFLLTNLIEHFSQYNLSNKNVNQDVLGQANEYLIKHFADITNKKAGEFYTPRSVTCLLNKIIDPQENESIYDPACGTGGMLLESINHLKKNKKNYKTIKMYGQEKNLTSNSIARINMFMHNVEDFNVKKGDTLKNPAFFDGDILKQFDCVIANPPFSLKNWGKENWLNDPYGRNLTGINLNENADMAWVQHMIASMNKNGRMVVVLPRGILSRQGSEKKIREQLIKKDLLETVICLGLNIFYGTQLAPCILVFRNNKKKTERKKIYFINAINEIKIGRSQNFLEDENINNIFEAYKSKKNIDKFFSVVDLDEIIKNDFNLNINLYINDESHIENIDSHSLALSKFKKTWKENQEIESNFTKIFNRFIL